MGIAVSVLLIIIVVTFLYALLCRKSSRRESEEAILDLDEGEATIIRRKRSNKAPCVIVIVCLVLIALLIVISYFVYEIRIRNEPVQGNYSTEFEFCVACGESESIFAMKTLVALSS